MGSGQLPATEFYKVSHRCRYQMSSLRWVLRVLLNTWHLFFPPDTYPPTDKDAYR